LDSQISKRSKRIKLFKVKSMEYFMLAPFFAIGGYYVGRMAEKKAWDRRVDQARKNIHRSKIDLQAEIEQYLKEN
jgi:hypothetical protein